MFHLHPSCLAFAAAGVTASFLCGPAPAQAAEGFDFVISDDRVVPATDFAAKISVIGSAIVDDGGDMPVTLSVDVAGLSYDVFSPSLDPWSGDVNTHLPARHAVIDQVFTAGDAIRIAARSWEPTPDATSLQPAMTVVSDAASEFVMVLRNGDAVPTLAGYAGQTSAHDFLAPYIDATACTVTIADDQVIYLFELGTTDLTSPAADFQDLVVLVTLGRTPDELRDPLPPADPPTPNAESRVAYD